MPIGVPASSAELDAIEADIDSWLLNELDENPVMVAVDRGEPGERRWFVRLRGEEKDYITVWFRLAQRSLHFETYVMPAPEENEALFYAHLLRRNLSIHGMSFAIGAENAVYLVGQLPIECFDVGQLDQVLGSTYQYVEQFFRPALRIGFASRMAP